MACNRELAMWRMVLALATLPGFASSARAETVDAPPALAVLVGPGIRRAWLEGPGGYPRLDQDVPVLAATVSYRVLPHLSFGVHAAGAHSSDQEDYLGSMDSETEAWTVIAVDAGVAATYEEGRFAVTPWLGRHFSRRHFDSTFCVFRHGMGCDEGHETEWTSDFTSWGVIASVVPFRELPVAVFADLQSGTGGAVLGPESMPRFGYSALTIGVAYRR